MGIFRIWTSICIFFNKDQEIDITFESMYKRHARQYNVAQVIGLSFKFTYERHVRRIEVPFILCSI